MYEDKYLENIKKYQKIDEDKRNLIHKISESKLIGYQKEYYRNVKIQIEDLKTTKTWITDEERQDVTDKIAEIRNWLKEQLEAQAQLKLSEDPVFQSADLMKKMAQLKKLYTKVANKKKPKPPKDEKSEEKAE